MPPARSYYEILGVPETATQDEIKKSFRRLVRQFHPDVHPDKKLAQKAFVQINEAYQTLSNPAKRHSYDLLQKARREHPRPGPSARYAGPSSHSRARPQQPAGGKNRSAAEALVKQAEAAFIRGRLAQAESLCRQALKMHPTSARACIVLGDIYAGWGKPDSALKYYSYAVQYDPASHEAQRKIERLTGGGMRGASAGRAASRQGSSALPSPIAFVSVLSGWTVFFLVFVFVPDIKASPTLPGQEGALAGWNAAMTFLIGGQGVLMGVLLRASGVLSHCEDDLMLETIRKGARKASPGIGVLVLLLTVVFYWLGLAIYLLIAVVQESGSRSLTRVFVGVTLYTLVVALLSEPLRGAILMIGGNLCFTAAMAGWWMVDIVKDALAKAQR